MSFAASGDVCEFLGLPLIDPHHVIAGLQDGVTVDWVVVSVATHEGIIFPQESFDMLPEELVGK